MKATSRVCLPDGKLVFLEKELLHNCRLCQDADSILFPNVQEPLCILVVLPIGSAEAERSFSCLRQIHSFHHDQMSRTYRSSLTSSARLAHEVIVNSLIHDNRHPGIAYSIAFKYYYKHEISSTRVQLQTAIQAKFTLTDVDIVVSNKHARDVNATPL